MKGYQFTVDCLECGGELRPVQAPAPHVKTLAVAIAECPACGGTWELQVVLRPMSVVRPEAGHGTLRRYKSGCRCVPCRRIAREERQAYRKRLVSA